VGETRIQLCGRLVARIEGVRIEERLPGRQGRLLLAYLVHERRTAVDRDRLMDVLWGDLVPDAADSALSALLSKLRRVVALEGRRSVRLTLPSETWVDVEAAREGLHRAESAARREEWAAAWGPARVAQHICERGFLVGESAEWARERRREVDMLLVRALELAGAAALHIGGGERATAERAARRLVELAPLRESGTRLLMEVLAVEGNRAEALVAYETLRRCLRDELGVAPCAETQALHRALLA
jgi:DNA-binding SARP family transcriptional activator